MTKRRFRAAAVQTLARLGDFDFNIALATQYVEDAVRQGAELIVFPECMDTGYLFDSAAHCRELAETVTDGPFVTALSELAPQAWHLHRQRHHRMGSREGEDLQQRHHVRPEGEIVCHYHKQFLATHDQNWFSLRRARLSGGRYRSRPDRPADLLRRTHPGNLPLHGDLGRRGDRRHGELLRHGSGRDVGPCPRL